MFALINNDSSVLANPVINSFSTKYPKDTSALLSSLIHFHPLSTEAAEWLLQHLQSISFRKGDFLLQAGKSCKQVFFVRKGAIRGFFKEGQKEITTWITIENEMVTAISSISNKEPSEENIQAIEECDTWAITYQDLDELFIKFPEVNITIRKLLEKYYSDAEARSYIARLSSAESRYQYFLKRFSHLANRIPLKYIASFLGITIETLSRVRKRIASSTY